MSVAPDTRARLPGDAVTVAVLLLLSALAWVASERLGDDGMRIGILTGSSGGHAMEGMDGMPETSMAFGLFLVTWLVMMAAMMFPAVAPVVLTFRRWASSRGRPASTTAAFVTGYLFVWGLVAVAAYLLLQGLYEWVPAENSTAVRVGAGLLVGAGVYQLSPLKSVCLRHCRSPLGVVMRYATLLGKGHVGPLRVGVVHGAYCLGCCWSLFVVLLALGMMNLVWMAVLAAIVLAEKVLPHGRLVSVAVGLALVGAGTALMVRPDALPALV